MKEQLITLKTAKLTKEKGFNISTKSFYGCDNPAGSSKPNQLLTIELKEEGNIETQSGTMIYSAPNQHILQKWLREKHNIHINIAWLDDVFGYYYILTTLLDNTDITEELGHNNYEDALETGLQEGLKLI